MSNRVFSLTTLLSILLLFSIALNLWQWQRQSAIESSSLIVSDAHSPAPNTPTESWATESPLTGSLLERDSALSPNTPEPVGLDLENQQHAFEQLTKWYSQANWSQLTVALRDYLRRYPDDTQALLLEADMVSRTQPLNIALVNYYALLELPLDDSTQKSIQEKIEQLFENATEQLRFDRAWDLLAALIEPLIQIAPSERRYLILLAEAYAQQANAVLMENTLAGLPFDDPAIESIRQILQRQLSVDDENETQTAQISDFTETDTLTNITRIPLDRLGNQYTLEIQLDNRPVRLMIDTGASTTAVTASAWSRLSRNVASRFIGVFKVNTAAGYIDAPMFAVKSVSMGALAFDDVSVMVIPSRMMGEDPDLTPQGLLGMNILSQYNFQIDQQNAQLLLRPRR